MYYNENTNSWYTSNSPRRVTETMEAVPGEKVVIEVPERHYIKVDNMTPQIRDGYTYKSNGYEMVRWGYDGSTSTGNPDWIVNPEGINGWEADGYVNSSNKLWIIMPDYDIDLTVSIRRLTNLICHDLYKAGEEGTFLLTLASGNDDLYSYTLRYTKEHQDNVLVKSVIMLNDNGSVSVYEAGKGAWKVNFRGPTKSYKEDVIAKIIYGFRLTVVNGKIIGEGGDVSTEGVYSQDEIIHLKAEVHYHPSLHLRVHQ